MCCLYLARKIAMVAFGLLVFSVCDVGAAQFTPPSIPSGGGGFSPGGNRGGFSPRGNSNFGRPRNTPRPSTGFRNPASRHTPRNNFGSQTPSSRHQDLINSRTSATVPSYGANRSGSNYGRPTPGVGGFQNPFSAPTAGVGIAGGRSRLGTQNANGRTTFHARHAHSAITSHSIGSTNPFADLNRSTGADKIQQKIDKLLGKNRNLGNLLHASSTARTLGLPSQQINRYRNDAMAMARDQIQSGASTPTPWVAMAKLSLESNDMKEFRRYSSDLSNRFPDNKHSRLFNGIDLLDKKDWKGAERELRLARAAGIPEKDLGGLLKIAIDNQKWIWEYAYIVAWLIGVWLLGMVVLYLVGIYLSKTTLSTIKSDPNADFSKQKFRNSLYRFIIFFAGIYYFISLPLVILVSIALPLALIYGALCLPVINLPIIAIVLFGGIGGVMTAASGLRASLSKIERKDVERKVSVEEAPKLWAVAKEVAEKVGTRPIDEIWLLGTSDLAVTEQGSFMEKLRDTGKRVLVLGTAAIDRMDESAFRAILAHEYGHFQNRDTAGGDISMRVNEAMNRFVDSILTRGKIRWWDIAVKFLQAYYILFNRMTFGASRLQEVLADRVAVKAYGGSAFRRGLKHVIRRGLESSVEIENKLTTAMVGEDLVAKKIDPDRFSPFERQFLSIAFDETIRTNSTENDTHPSPKERFAMSAKLEDQGEELKSKSQVWSLFKDPSAVRKEMADEIDKLIKQEGVARKRLGREGIRYYSEIAQQTNDPRLFIERGQLYSDLGEHEKAIKDFKKAIRSAGPHIQLSMAVADLQRRLGNFDDAIATLEKGVEPERLGPEEKTKDVQFQYWLLLGKLHELNSKARDARACYEKAGDYISDSYALQFRLGRLEMKAGDPEAAIKYFDLATELCRNAPEPFYYRGLILAKQGNLTSAKEELTTAAKLDGLDPRPLKALKKIAAPRTAKAKQ